jgi:phage terminase large subunit GpA-like protein
MNDRGVMVAPGERPRDYDDAMGCLSEGGPGVELERYDAKGRVAEVVPLGWGDPHIPAGVTHASFWVSGCASFSAKKTYGYLAAQMVQARQKRDPQAEQAVHNIDFGEVYQVRGDVPEWQTVKALTDEYELGQVPARVTTLVATVDVSADRVQYIVRGFAPDSDMSSWLIERGELWGATDQPAVWKRLEDEVLFKSWSGLRLSIMAIDSAYRTDEVYEFSMRHMGMVYPTKGRDYMDRTWYAAAVESDYRGRANPIGIYLWHINTDVTKSWVHARIRRPIDQAGAWRVPRDIDDEYCKQIVAESRMVKNNGKPEWIRHRANHFLDCEQLAYFAVSQITIHSARPGMNDDDDDVIPPPPAFDMD